MTLALVQEIGELKALGFSRWEALLLVALVSLFAYLRAQIARDRKAFAKAEKQRDEERTERDKDRAAREAKIEKRLTDSEDKHKECDSDRQKLREGQHKLELELTRLKACPKAGCPMRLP